MSRNGFSPKRAEPIIAGWSGQKVIREIMAFLQGHGVSTWRAVRIYRTAFVEDHDVIQTIAANLSDHALDVRVLIGRAWRRDDFRDPHGLDPAAEVPAIRGIAIAQQIARSGVPRERLGYLTR